MISSTLSIFIFLSILVLLSIESGNFYSFYYLILKMVFIFILLQLGVSGVVVFDFVITYIITVDLFFILFMLMLFKKK